MKAPGPIVRSVGLLKGEHGWKAVLLETRDGKVLSEENLSVESSKSVAFEELKVAVIRRLLSP